MNKPINETLEFKGYFLEDNYAAVPEVKGVYCAYAASKNADTGKWEGLDIVYFGKSEEGDSSVRKRIYAHMAEGDSARGTLKDGEKLLYAYAETEYPDACEKALVAAHSDLPRLANEKLVDGYAGPKILLAITGKCWGMKSPIGFESTEEGV